MLRCSQEQGAISYIQKHSLNARPPNGAFLEKCLLRVSLGEWLGVFGV